MSSLMPPGPRPAAPVQKPLPLKTLDTSMFPSNLPDVQQADVDQYNTHVARINSGGGDAATHNGLADLHQNLHGTFNQHLTAARQSTSGSSIKQSKAARSMLGVLSDNQKVIPDHVRDYGAKQIVADHTIPDVAEIVMGYEREEV